MAFYFLKEWTGRQRKRPQSRSEKSKILGRHTRNRSVIHLTMWFPHSTGTFHIYDKYLSHFLLRSSLFNVAIPACRLIGDLLRSPTMVYGLLHKLRSLDIRSIWNITVYPSRFCQSPISNNSARKRKGERKEKFLFLTVDWRPTSMFHEDSM